ncbi:MAG: DUF4440 domain-containing protein [Rhodobacteraceae bacterium]|nr:DUF4440 domain-containing protein [Paracoccaceae bacterium]
MTDRRIRVWVAELVLGLALAIAAPAAAQQPPVMEGPQAEVDAVLALLKAWGERRNAGDVEGVVALHHPDVRIMTRDRAVLEGHDGVREFYGENYGSGTTRKQYGQLQELRVFDGVAFFSGTFLVVDEARGIEDPGRYVIILRKGDTGNWLIYRDIDTPSPDGLVLKP